jgi:hypothetical protein
MYSFMYILLYVHHYLLSQSIFFDTREARIVWTISFTCEYPRAVCPFIGNKSIRAYFMQNNCCAHSFLIKIHPGVTIFYCCFPFVALFRILMKIHTKIFFFIQMFMVDKIFFGIIYRDIVNRFVKWYRYY